MPVDTGESKQLFFPCEDYLAAIGPGSNERTLLASSELGPITAAAANDDLLVWSEVSQVEFASKVRGWTSKTGAFDAFGLPAYNTGLGLSPTRVAGIMGAGISKPNPFHEYLKRGRLWWAPWAGDSVHSSPELPYPFYPTSFVATWGEFIAVEIFFEPNESGRELSFLLLARVTDWKMRILERTPEIEFGEGSFALTSKYLYVVPKVMQERGGYLAASAFRYDLSAFDSVGVPLEPAP
ncbi:MAG TPA: hypothetical protein VN033_09070 [Vulgatibacter sp.]|nr:hypothetical protein [Vulgatibacter sp.]